METTSVNATTSTQTEVINTTRDKCIGSAVKYKNKKSTIQGWALWSNQSWTAQYKGSQNKNM